MRRRPRRRKQCGEGVDAGGEIGVLALARLSARVAAVVGSFRPKPLVIG